jgi:hypothetical protein
MFLLLTFISQLLFVVAVGSLATSCPRFFEFELIANVNGTWVRNNPTTFQSNQIYSIGYRMVASFLIIYLVPMSALAGLNVRILSALRQSTGHVHQHQNSTRDTRSGDCLVAKCLNSSSCNCSRCLSRRRHYKAWHDDPYKRRPPQHLHEAKADCDEMHDADEKCQQRRRDTALSISNQRYAGLT